MKDLPKTADIAIIGGGIMGLCTAYYLSRRLKRGVILFEKDLLAQASTGLCVGGIRQQFTHPSNILLSQETVRLFESFHDRFQTDIGFEQAGYLFLAQTAETWMEFQQGLKIQKNFGVPVESLTPEEIKYRWPALNVTDLQGGTFCAEDGYADPYLTAMAFAQAARDAGVQIFERTEVLGIIIRSGRVQGLKTSRGELAVPRVLNASGPWARAVAILAGFDLPVLPFRRQVFMTHPVKSFVLPFPMVLDSDELFYLRGYEPGLLIGKSDRDEPSSYQTHVDRKFLEEVALAAIHRAPALEDAGILRGWAGLYSITPDENPIIGPLPELDGFFCAVGFSGHGFQHGPAVGRILSEILVDDRTSFDLTPFRPDRFDVGSGKAEKLVI